MHPTKLPKGFSNLRLKIIVLSKRNKSLIFEISYNICYQKVIKEARVPVRRPIVLERQHVFRNGMWHDCRISCKPVKAPLLELFFYLTVISIKSVSVVPLALVTFGPNDCGLTDTIRLLSVSIPAAITFIELLFFVGLISIF